VSQSQSCAETHDHNNLILGLRGSHGAGWTGQEQPCGAATQGKRERKTGSVRPELKSGAANVLARHRLTDSFVDSAFRFGEKGPPWRLKVLRDTTDRFIFSWVRRRKY